MDYIVILSFSAPQSYKNESFKRELFVCLLRWFVLSSYENISSGQFFQFFGVWYLFLSPSHSSVFFFLFLSARLTRVFWLLVYTSTFIFLSIVFYISFILFSPNKLTYDMFRFVWNVLSTGFVTFKKNRFMIAYSEWREYKNIRKIHAHAFPQQQQPWARSCINNCISHITG